jgi:hypothetical protein
MGAGLLSLEVKLPRLEANLHLRLVPTLRMCGATIPFLHTSIWQTPGQLYLLLYDVRTGLEGDSAAYLMGRQALRLYRLQLECDHPQPSAVHVTKLHASRLREDFRPLTALLRVNSTKLQTFAAVRVPSCLYSPGLRCLCYSGVRFCCDLETCDSYYSVELKCVHLYPRSLYMPSWHGALWFFYCCSLYEAWVFVSERLKSYGA